MNYYSMPTKEVLDEFSVSQMQGLSKEQVRENREVYGENKLPPQPKDSFLKRLTKQLINPLVLILIGAFVLTIFLHEYVDALVIFISVLVNVVVALVQEGKASAAYEVLQKKRVHKAIVIRGGSKQEIKLAQIVKGDIIVLQAGMYVPADIRVLESTNMTANQVMFTGESVAIEKESSGVDTEEVFERSSMLFTGSTVASGSGLGVVTSIGTETIFAGIADSLLQVKKEKSPIEKESEKIAKILSVVAGVIIVVILLLGIYRGLPFYEIMLLSVAVAVSAVPEGLPSAITAILAYGASRIGKEGGLVKNLSSAQTLGSTDIILTDKTGTLTYGNMEIVEIITRENTEDARRKVIEHGLYATDVFYDEHGKKFVGDDVDQAIGKYFVRGGEYVNTFLSKAPSSHVVPFDSRNKFFASVRKWNDEDTVFAKGAFSVLWGNCTHVLAGHSYREITDEDYDYYRNLIDEATNKGKRVIAVAHNESVNLSQDESNPDKILEGAVFCGLLVMEDRVRETAAESVFEAIEAGVKVIMITGDAANTARNIAYETGIVDHPDAQVMMGIEMEKYSDQELHDKIINNELRIFSRVSPDHKLRLVDLLTERGSTVAMTGDGVNDSLALSRAAIGISLASATEIAKESADLILTNNSFSGIVFALKEGRRMAVNITKTIIYLLATSFSEVIVITGSLLVGLPIPFLPSHILWANILEEGIMNFAFLFEENREPYNKPRDIVDAKVIKLTVFIGILNGVLFLSLFGGLYIFTDMSAEMKRTIMFGALAVDSLFLAVAMRDISNPFWKTPMWSNKFFVVAMGINIVLLTLTIGTQLGRTLLHLEPMTLFQIGLIITFGLFNLLIVEVGKKYLWK